MRIVWVAAGLAAGYVLGTKAGRERYEQIKQAADRFMNYPVVIDAQAKVKELAEHGVEVAAAKVGLGSDATSQPTTAVITPDPLRR